MDYQKQNNFTSYDINKIFQRLKPIQINQSVWSRFDQNSMIMQGGLLNIAEAS